MRPPKGSPIRILKIKDTDDMKTIYAKARRSFTAADLALYANDDPTVPAEQVLADMRAIHREESRRLKKKKK